MIEFYVEEASVADLYDHLEVTRRRIMDAVKVGMQEGVKGEAEAIVDAMPGVVVNRTGDFAAAILRNPYVTQEGDITEGQVPTNVGGKHLGLWLEKGVSEPSVSRGVLLGQFAPADGRSGFSHGHVAFQIKPHPFINRAVEEYQPTLVDIIRMRIMEAVDGTV